MYQPVTSGSDVTFQRHHTDATPTPAAADAGSSGGRTVRTRTQGAGVGLTLPQATPSPARVQEEVQRPWFEREMPGPAREVAGLVPDSVLAQELQDPVTSVLFYDQAVQSRVIQERDNKEYKFAPLLVTLGNMDKLTAHMLDDQQFSQPLALDERHALLALQVHIRDLIGQGAPYKRTVKLAFLMCILQEIMTARHVIEPLQDTQSALLSRRRLMGACFGRFTPQGHRPVKTAEVPLAEAFTCHWKGMSVHGQSYGTSALTIGGLLAELVDMLENPRVFVYPSFAPLDVSDFCCFGHLPVYPLGMMSAYALNADGRMYTPLRFFMHDVFHSDDQRWQHLDGSRPLESIRSRLRFQQLVRCCLPAEPGAELKRALELVLFFLFHEEPVRLAQDTLEQKSFLELFRVICEVRRMEHLGYGPTYRAVTDQQALLACFWVYRVYGYCSTSEPDRPADSLVQEFVQQTVPALREHQRFIDEHRESLHRYFRAGARVGSTSTCQQVFWYQNKGLCTSSGGIREELPLEYSHDLRAEAAVRHTDLVYFNSLLADEEVTQMEQALGVRLPAGRPHAPCDSKAVAGCQSESTGTHDKRQQHHAGVGSIGWHTDLPSAQTADNSAGASQPQPSAGLQTKKRRPGTSTSDLFPPPAQRPAQVAARGACGRTHD